MPYPRAYSNYWWQCLRTDGIWRTDPRNNNVTIYRFLRDLRVMLASVPGQGRLIDDVGSWFTPDRDRVDDGRAFYGFAFGEFGVFDTAVIVSWPSLQHNAGSGRYWSEGVVHGDVLSWSFTPWTGRQRPAGYRPPEFQEQARFVAIPRW